MLVIYGVCATYSGGALADKCEPKRVNSGYWCIPNLKCAPGCFCTGNTNSNYSTDIWEGKGYNEWMHPFAGCGGCITNGIREDFEVLCKIHFKNFKQNKVSSYSTISTALALYLREKKSIYNINNIYDQLAYSEELANSLGIFSCPSQYPESDAGASKIADCYVSVGGKKVYNKTLNCKAGQYLPRNSNTCSACKTGNRYYCPGGTFHTSTESDQGIKTENTVPAGYYLPAGQTQPVPCKGAKSYCPGGKFDQSTKDQGIFDCPNGGRANKDKTACTITILKEQMKECWTDSVDPDKYKTCVLAKRYYK